MKKDMRKRLLAAMAALFTAGLAAPAATAAPVKREPTTPIKHFV